MVNIFLLGWWFWKKWLPRGGEKIFGCLRRPKIYHPPLSPGSNVVRGVVRQNFHLKGGSPTPHHPPRAHVWSYIRCDFGHQTLNCPPPYTKTKRNPWGFLAYSALVLIFLLVTQDGKQYWVVAQNFQCLSLLFETESPN